MAGKIDTRLKQLGLTLPVASVPVANYIPYVKTGNLVFVAGQIPLLNGAVHYQGIVGLDVTLEEAVNAARQIGDDTLQRNAGQRPMPHTFTHGTAAQRSGWFLRGLKSGDLGDCDTFAAKKL